ncbi:hypothetical protein PR048_004376 [Dryococelus australis]|uniref:Uncharacterized protein n=1 Tax=Dryococelus australis TaxID=614101 RepID=A0ABQ9I595_9NEOP|nr:hypothetical protein PR048_004376 [Dryococelus australis]
MRTAIMQGPVRECPSGTEALANVGRKRDMLYQHSSTRIDCGLAAYRQRDGGCAQESLHYGRAGAMRLLVAIEEEKGKTADLWKRATANEKQHCLEHRKIDICYLRWETCSSEPHRTRVMYADSNAVIFASFATKARRLTSATSSGRLSEGSNPTCKAASARSKRTATQRQRNLHKESQWRFVRETLPILGYCVVRYAVPEADFEDRGHSWEWLIIVEWHTHCNDSEPIYIPYAYKICPSLFEKLSSGRSEKWSPGTTVALTLYANRIHYPAGSPDFRKWESCRTMPLVGGISPGSPVSPAPSFRHRSILTLLTLIGSQDRAVKSHPNLFTHLNPIPPHRPRKCLTRRQNGVAGELNVVTPTTNQALVAYSRPIGCLRQHSVANKTRVPFVEDRAVEPANGHGRNERYQQHAHFTSVMLFILWWCLVAQGTVLSNTVRLPGRDKANSICSTKLSPDVTKQLPTKKTGIEKASADTITAHKRALNKIDVQNMYTKVTFAIGPQFVRHALDDPEPIAHLQRASVHFRTDDRGFSTKVPTPHNVLLRAHEEGLNIRLCTLLYEPGSTLQSRAKTYWNVDVAQTPSSGAEGGWRAYQETRQRQSEAEGADESGGSGGAPTQVSDQRKSLHWVCRRRESNSQTQPLVSSSGGNFPIRLTSEDPANGQRSDGRANLISQVDSGRGPRWESGGGGRSVGGMLRLAGWHSARYSSRAWNVVISRWRVSGISLLPRPSPTGFSLPSSWMKFCKDKSTASPRVEIRSRQTMSFLIHRSGALDRGNSASAYTRQKAVFSERMIFITANPINRRKDERLSSGSALTWLTQRRIQRVSHEEKDIGVTCSLGISKRDKSAQKGRPHVCSSQWNNDASSSINSTVKFSQMPNKNANFADCTLAVRVTAELSSGWGRNKTSVHLIAARSSRPVTLHLRAISCTQTGFPRGAVFRERSEFADSCKTAAAAARNYCCGIQRIDDGAYINPASVQQIARQLKGGPQRPVGSRIIQSHLLATGHRSRRPTGVTLLIGSRKAQRLATLEECEKLAWTDESRHTSGPADHANPVRAPAAGGLYLQQDNAPARDRVIGWTLHGLEVACLVTVVTDLGNTEHFWDAVDRDAAVEFDSRLLLVTCGVHANATSPPSSGRKEFAATRFQAAVCNSAANAWESIGSKRGGGGGQFSCCDWLARRQREPEGRHEGPPVRRHTNLAATLRVMTIQRLHGPWTKTINSSRQSRALGRVTTHFRRREENEVCAHGGPTELRMRTTSCPRPPAAVAHEVRTLREFSENQRARSGQLRDGARTYVRNASRIPHELRRNEAKAVKRTAMR